MTQHRTMLISCCALACIGLLLTALSGCNIVSGAAYVVKGPDKTPARYTLPEKKVVIFIDDRISVIPRARLRRQMALRATTELLQTQRVVPAALSPDTMIRLAAAETSGKISPIDEMGRQAGADVVIYAVPRAFRLGQGTEPVPICTLDVKVIDTATGQRLWPAPTQPEYFTLTVELAPQQLDVYQSQQRLEGLQQTLAELTGLRLAQLFYEHDVNPLDAEISK